MNKPSYWVAVLLVCGVGYINPILGLAVFLYGLHEGWFD